MVETLKRQPPRTLQKILELDANVTQRFVLWANKLLPFRTTKMYYKMLEISCHGIPWLAFWIAFTWLFNNPDLIQMQVNMLIGLFLDIILVAVTKAFVRRRRPASNVDDALGQMGPDKFSFPSGHASRTVFVAYFFINLYPLPIFFVPPLLAWASSVCMSRVLLNRHYILDVLAGVALGLAEGLFLGLLWLDNDTTLWIMSSLSDEKLDGGEYHV
ncbi:uncharacterized protein CBL_11993 [Carabus blaptoides fortunei]